MSRASTHGNVNPAMPFPATARGDVPEDHPMHCVRQEPSWQALFIYQADPVPALRAGLGVGLLECRSPTT